MTRFAADRMPEGWFTSIEGKAYADQALRGPRGVVEVGCWLGRSLAFLLQRRQRLPEAARPGVFAVDTWKPPASFAGRCEGDPFAVFVANLAALGFRPGRDYAVIAEPSLEAATRFPDASLGFVMLDADHSREAVMADLMTWWPKIAPGGAIGGHDYGGAHRGVREAVDSFFPKGVSVLGNFWWRRRGKV